MVHKPQHGMLLMVCNKADALREFENCLVKFGTYYPALVMHEPNHVDLRKAYEAAGILNKDDLSLALSNKQYYPEVNQMNDFMGKRIEKPLAGMINGAVKWTSGKAGSAQVLTAFSKLYIKEQLVRPNKEFKAVLQPLCQIGTIWWDPEFLKRLPELNKWVYNWIFKMFDICPVVFFKMIVTMLVGHNNRQCLMLVSGDVLMGKSLLISVLKEVVGGKLFMKLSKSLPYTEASGGVFVDTPTDIQLQLLYSNRGIFSEDRNRKYGYDKEHSLPPFWVTTNTPMPLYLNEDEKDKKEKDKFLELKSRGFILTTKAQMKEKPPYSIEEIANAVVLWIMEIYRKPPTDDSVRPWYSFLDDLEEAWTVVHGRFKLTMKQQWNYEGNTLEWEKQNHYGAKTWCHALSDEQHQLERMGMTDGDILKMKSFILRNNLKAKFKLRLPTIL